MTASLNHHLNQILTDLENSATIRQHITTFDHGSTLLTVETVIMHQITLLGHQIMSWNTKHGHLSPEILALQRIIEITNTLSKITIEDEGIEAYKLELMDHILTEEFKKLKNEDVAFDLKLFTGLRANMNNQVLPNAAKELGKRIMDALRIQERTSWIYANTILEVWLYSRLEDAS